MAQATLGVAATSLTRAQNSGTPIQAVSQPNERKAAPALDGDSYQRRSTKDVMSAVVKKGVVNGVSIAVLTVLWRAVSKRSWGINAAAAAVMVTAPDVLKALFAGAQRALPAAKAVDSSVTNHIAQHVSVAAALKILGNSWIVSLIVGGLSAVATNFLIGKFNENEARIRDR